MFAKNISRVVSLAAFFLLLLAGCGGGTPAASPDPTIAVLGEVQGRVEVLNPGEAGAVAAADGMILHVNGQVATGEDGRVRLDLSSGTVIRLAANTNFILVANDSQPAGLWTRLKIEAGKLWIALNNGSMDVETPAGLASVRGSHLMLWIEPATRNIYVNCMEGRCSASNASGSLDLATGQGALLYHVEAGGSPPPPALYTIPWEDFQEWLENNPEAGNILPGLVPTLTALPRSTATPLPPSPTATATPSCLTLLAPANDASLPGSGMATFSWTAWPGAAKYRWTVVSPSGAVNTLTLGATSTSRYLENLQAGGVYHWHVTALDAAGAPICVSETFAFTKEKSLAPGVPAGAGNANFLSEDGPQGVLTHCGDEWYTVTVTDPNGVVSVSVNYLVSYGGSGSFLLSPVGGYTWSAQYCAPTASGATVIWWFEVLDGAGNLETSGRIFQFTCGSP